MTDDRIDAPVLSDGAASYLHGAGLIGEVRSGTAKFYHADALGTTRAVTNTSAATTDTLTTDAFGLTVASSGSTPSPFGFAGQHGYQSDSTGLMRLGHRYYDASTGRFLSRDPIRDGNNWYTYCNNDPVNKIDSTGLKPSDDALFGGGIARVVAGLTFITGAFLVVATAPLIALVAVAAVGGAALGYGVGLIQEAWREKAA